MEQLSEKDISLEELIEDPAVREIARKILKESIDKVNELYEKTKIVDKVQKT